MHLLQLLTPFLSLLGAGLCVAPGRLEQWVRLGFQLVQWDQLHSCLHTASRSESECRWLLHLPLSSVAVYVSEPRGAAGRTGLWSP